MTDTPAVLGGDPVRKDKPDFPGWPVFGEEEERRLLETFRTGNWWYGERVAEFEAAYARFQNAAHGVSCTSGTTALLLAYRALGIGAGDEVLVPAYTFMATATTVIHANAIPVFVDVEPDTLNMDLDQAESLITDRTRAIVVVHFAGLPVDLDRTLDIARRHDLFVVEDAAHGWGSQWKGKGVGAIGDAGTFSFQHSKNITGGEGGIVLSDNKEVANLVRSLSNCGREEGRAWYDIPRIGTNFRMTELQAAILLGQLERLPEQTARREANAAVLSRELAGIEGIHVPASDPRVTRRAWHMYSFRFVSSEFGGLSRARFGEALGAEGIPCSHGYLEPVHAGEGFRRIRSTEGRENCPFSCPYYGREVDFSKVRTPVAERLCKEETIWIPHSVLLAEEEDMMDIVRAVRRIQQHQAAL